MPLSLASLAEISRLGFDAVIDVRSPSEFAEDHIPGAVNLPVLDDGERARVGTIYVRQNRFLARRIGAALIARNVAGHLDTFLADKPPSWRPLVYCWRGGQRSGAFATIAGQVGWRVETLAGGYRSYRRLVQAALYDAPFPAPVVVIDGNTGTAKTELLARLAGRGVQVIDLEGLANHRGSLFGARAGGQPTQKAFESELAAILSGLDPARPVAVEAESSKVGGVSVPPALWRAMTAAPRIEIVAPRHARAAYLARAYADITADAARLAGVLDALRPYHPAETVAHWRALLAAGDHVTLADGLMAEHYDPRYARSRARRAGGIVARIEVPDLSDAALDEAAERLAAEVGRAAAAIPRPAATAR